MPHKSFLRLKVYNLCVIPSVLGGVSLSHVSPVSSIQWLSWLHVCLVSSVCSVVLSPSLSIAALPVSTTLHFGFFMATKSAGCSLGSS